MITSETFERLMETIPTDVVMNEREWFAKRGIDVDAVTKWCLAQSMEDFENLQAGRDAGTQMGMPLAVSTGAMFAAAYHMGLIMGIRLHEAPVPA